MKTSVNINFIRDNKREIRQYAEIIADFDGAKWWQYVMAFGAPDEDGEEVILWSVQAGDGRESVKDAITWDGVQRVEVYDYGHDGERVTLKRECVYVANRAALARYTAARQAEEFSVESNYTKYEVAPWAPREKEHEEAPAASHATRSAVVAALTTIAALNPNGYTVDAHTLQPVTHGYAVAMAETQESFGPEGLAKVVDFAAKDSRVIAFGGWLDSQTEQYYYDAVIIVTDSKLAYELAEQNGQLAFFDLDNMQEIRLDGANK